MMKVLHIVSRLGYGGIERYLLSLIDTLDDREFVSDVVCIGRHASASDPLVQDLRQAGATVWFETIPLYPSAALLRFRREVVRRQYDLVHCHLADASGLFAAALAGSGIPLIAAYHHANAGTANGLAAPALLAYRCWLRFARVPLSGCSAHAISSHFGTTRSGRAAYYGIDLDRFDVPTPSERARAREALGIASGRYVVSHIGRFVPEKDHALLLDAAALAVQRAPDMTFVLAGDGPLRRSIQRKVRLHPALSNAVLFLGAVSAPEQVLHASDVFFMPSRSEGFGLALLEACACGLPVVATDLPAFREFVAGWPGIFLERAAPQALSARLLALHEHPEWGARPQASRDAVRARFSKRAAADRWRSVAFEAVHRPEGRV